MARVRLLGFFALVALSTFAVVLGSASAQTIFDDFNSGEGHFTSIPSASPSSVGTATTSTADQVADPTALEGAGFERLNLTFTGSGTTFRTRVLSGGSVPANNVIIPITAGTEGFIGYYVRTTSTGWETSLNIETSENTAATIWGSPSTPIIADGQWHLYEWDLDAAVWGTVPGIISHTTSALANNNWTIDSIYFRDTTAPLDASAVIDFDFVAQNPAGSIAGLLPATPGIGADFDNSGTVDGRDFLIWQRGSGLQDQTNNVNGDANDDHVVNFDDFKVFKTQFGGAPFASAAAAAIPEPAAAVLALAAVVGLAAARRRS